MFQQLFELRMNISVSIRRSFFDCFTLVVKSSISEIKNADLTCRFKVNLIY